MTKQQTNDKEWCLYILINDQRMLYVGISNDLPRRLKKHNDGKGARYTRGRGPWRIAKSWPMPSKSHALRAEYFLKKQRRQYKLYLISGTKELGVRWSMEPKKRKSAEEPEKLVATPEELQKIMAMKQDSLAPNQDGRSDGSGFLSPQAGYVDPLVAMNEKYPDHDPEA